MNFHLDFVAREQVIANYLYKKLDERTAEEFEAHYLFCDECYEELRATELLIYGLGQISVERSETNNVAIIRFLRSSELTRGSLDTGALVDMVRSQSDTRVLIDLSNVSRIDSLGLGMLMNCYCHAVKNHGMLKLLNPNAQVKRVLKLTKMDSVVPIIDEERSARQSFNSE